MLADPDIRDLINEIYDVLSVGVDTSTGEDTSSDLSAGLHESTYRFSGFKTYHEMNEVSHLLLDEAGNIRPFNDFMKDVRGIDKQYNENYLKSEYLLVSQSAAMAAKWEEIEADGDRYDLQYRTAGDENVRAEHAALDGVTLPSSDPFWESYYPPNGYRCRCTAVQVRKGKYPRYDSAQATAKGDKMTTGKLSIFRFNPGKTRSAVPPKHPYMPTGCGDCDFQVQLSYDQNKDKCVACKNITEQSRIKHNEEIYEKLKKDPNYKNVEFDRNTGGLRADHKDHHFDKIGGQYERHVQNAGYKEGHSVILESELTKTIGERHTEGTWDGLKIEIAGRETATVNNIMRGLKHCASKRTTEVAVLDFPNGGFDKEKLSMAMAKYNGLKKLNDGQYLKFKQIICVQNEKIAHTIVL